MCYGWEVFTGFEGSQAAHACPSGKGFEDNLKWWEVTVW
jgi:hypothetical protein